MVVGELIGSEGGGGDIGRRCDCFFDRGFDRREREKENEKCEGKRCVVERDSVL